MEFDALSMFRMYDVNGDGYLRGGDHFRAATLHAPHHGGPTVLLGLAGGLEPRR